MFNCRFCGIRFRDKAKANGHEFRCRLKRGVTYFSSIKKRRTFRPPNTKTLHPFARLSSMARY